jgi:hypothetical protein
MSGVVGTCTVGILSCKPVSQVIQRSVIYCPQVDFARPSAPTPYFAALSFIQVIGTWLGGSVRFFLNVIYFGSTVGTVLLLAAMFAVVIWRQRQSQPT